ncbi:MAG: pre-16S rRNA-processing nuclease YqgF [Candidatus Eremiobacteraeota bacterium]|nr:pre-16S rRNA-processing nuclease YqgF [Candidatus Eremiobacteraeota bacterium]MBC5802831.1 pre-16S rRNA-processing nuclease YqgF [Candidatus Eremiobacteraeota bacterium]MBC5822295.1 pre-16S rRNA-processing nuclease YqgF [Candidatus Eremiobacteraeota bacterium]
MTERIILGIDPGTRKCGFAVIAAGVAAPLELGIVPTPELGATVARLVRQYPLTTIALGGGTHTAPVGATLQGFGLPVDVVDERETTLRARHRYFTVNPPRGWRRLVPRGMLLPPVPIDDFAALLIAERLVDSRRS